VHARVRNSECFAAEKLLAIKQHVEVERARAPSLGAWRAIAPRGSFQRLQAGKKIEGCERRVDEGGRVEKLALHNRAHRGRAEERAARDERGGGQRAQRGKCIAQVQRAIAQVAA
jgi:hypothetical protein